MRGIRPYELCAQKAQAPEKWNSSTCVQPRPMRCVSTIMSNVDVSFHVGFIQELAGFGVELAFRGYLPQKNIINQPSILRDRTWDAQETGVCCGLQNKIGILRNSYVDFIFLYHWIFHPFLVMKLFHLILNYQSHNHAILDPCRDGCLANTDQCNGQCLQYRP